MFIEAKDDGSGGDNWTTGATSRAKLQSNRHHQQTNIQIFSHTGCPSPTNSVKALKGKISHSMDLLTPSSLGGLPTLSVTINSSWLVTMGEGCHASHQPSDAKIYISVYSIYSLIYKMQQTATMDFFLVQYKNCILTTGTR